jgi:TPR repeat protein
MANVHYFQDQCYSSSVGSHTIVKCSRYGNTAKKYACYTLIILLNIVQAVLATNTMSGDISDQKNYVCSGKGKVWIVEKDIFIPIGRTVILESGVYLFKPSTGLKINGTLIVRGTAREPIVFSSVYDKKYNVSSEQSPASGDWNGIFISKEANNVCLSNIEIKYSRYSIKAESINNFEIFNGRVNENSQTSVTIGNKPRLVPNDMSFNYSSGIELIKDSTLTLITKLPSLALETHDTPTLFKQAKQSYLINEFADAFIKFKMAAELDDLKAQFITGYMYENKLGIDSKDYQEAFNWYKKAASKGDTASIVKMGNMIETKKVFYNSLNASEEAYKLYKKAADLNNSDAMFYLASLLEKNQYFTEASIWYRKALVHGNCSAMVALGKIYLSGIDGIMQPDSEKGLELFKIATKYLNPEAFFRIGKMAQVNGPIDSISAEIWFVKAANAGFYDAVNELKQIYIAEIHEPKYITEYEEECKYMPRQDGRYHKECISHPKTVDNSAYYSALQRAETMANDAYKKRCENNVAILLEILDPKN